MASLAITGQDTIKLNDRSLIDLADGDVGALTYPNDLAAVKVGKNGNSLYALNESGRQAELVLRLVRATPDDKWLNNQFTLMGNNFPGYVLLSGELLKKVGDGKSNVAKDTYVLGGGVVFKAAEATANVEGSTDAAIVIWRIRFAQAVRVIQ